MRMRSILDDENVMLDKGGRLSRVRVSSVLNDQYMVLNQCWGFGCMGMTGILNR